jgi:hypothetical protein
MADEVEKQPMVLNYGFIMEKINRPIVRADDRVSGLLFVLTLRPKLTARPGLRATLRRVKAKEFQLCNVTYQALK